MTENAVLKSALSSLKKLQTSTGDAYSKESALDALINIQYLKKSIENVEKSLRKSVQDAGVDLPYENAIGTIGSKRVTETTQNVKAIIDNFGIEKLLKLEAIKIVKARFDENDKKIVALHETSVQTGSALNITLKNQPPEVGVFTLA